jgi:hypothetical protein
MKETNPFKVTWMRLYIIFSISGGTFAFLFLGLTLWATMIAPPGYYLNTLTMGSLFAGSAFVGVFSCAITEILIWRKKVRLNGVH